MLTFPVAFGGCLLRSDTQKVYTVHSCVLHTVGYCVVCTVCVLHIYSILCCHIFCTMPPYILYYAAIYSVLCCHILCTILPYILYYDAIYSVLCCHIFCTMLSYILYYAQCCHILYSFEKLEYHTTQNMSAMRVCVYIHLIINYKINSYLHRQFLQPTKFNYFPKKPISSISASQN